MTGSSLDVVSLAKKAGWTPGARDVDALLERLANAPTDDSGEELALDCQRALLRVEGSTVSERILPRLVKAVRPARARFVRVMGELARVRLDDEHLASELRTLAGDGDLKARLTAIHALGRLPGPLAEKTLLSRWAAEPRPEERRALLRALGTAGGAAALAVLSGTPPLEGDALAATLQSRAVLILKRTVVRDSEEAGGVDATAPFSEHAVVELSTRSGLEGLLADEARARGFKIPGAPKVGSGKLRIKGVKSLGDLSKLRLQEGLAIVVKNEILKDALASGNAETLARALAKPAVAGLMSSLTKGKVRFRLSWEGRGRAEVWKLAECMAAAAPQLINDPTESVWEVCLEDGTGVLLKPRRLADSRFDYRRAEVPAASKPSLAAALAMVAGARPDDVVWDPFVGSGLELIERAKLGPYAELHGNDLDPLALAAAHENLAAAGVENVQLMEGDALLRRDLAPTLILTNPPMGRRVQRGNLRPLLEGFVKLAAKILRPGGRLVWVSPLPDWTAALAHLQGFEVAKRVPLTMGGSSKSTNSEEAAKGGFPAELQMFVKK